MELYIRAAVEDRDARIKRRRQCCALILELNRLIDPVEERYPDLKLEEKIDRLSGPDRAQARVIYRELCEMQGPAVSRDRQKWHEAVENEIMDQLPRGSTNVKKIVAAVLSRDPTFPRASVQRYVEYLLQLPILLGCLETGE